ncbi:hypothetical protein RHMOL_Rhmol07G0001600 [Rhododendron molle]|uniref:Uncharacterized protein n=1 Tax=Rhododendron molle TaxID=49168 RepID=A0ACC0MVG1_RHOML|nr:hypothetical protein RHMOL_Rhmol07G0001600 [Rhododendron molle]
MAVNCIQDQNLPSSRPLSALIFDCRYLMTLLPAVKLKHDLREANICADILAKNALNLPLGFIYFSVIPSDLCFQFQQDFVGIKYPRLIRIV